MRIRSGRIGPGYTKVSRYMDDDVGLDDEQLGRDGRRSNPEVCIEPGGKLENLGGGDRVTMPQRLGSTQAQIAAYGRLHMTEPAPNGGDVTYPDCQDRWTGGKPMVHARFLRSSPGICGVSGVDP